MKRLLILYPHWPPSNLAGMHRARLTANFAIDAGWNVTVIAVKPSDYEETLDEEMTQLVRAGIEVIHVPALPVIRIFGRRAIGDIGLRGYSAMKRAATLYLTKEKVDFIWIPIPSWYTSLMGRPLSKRFGVPFGIDYIDPWVYQLTKHEPPFSRAWWTRLVALTLEPQAIRHASLISGVSEAYFTPALDRVFGTKTRPETVAMPYGFDPADHAIEPSALQYPFDPQSNRFILYAGAFLPHSERFARHLFCAISALYGDGLWPQDLILQFVGTGKRPGPSIEDLAAEEGVSKFVREHPSRIPFLTIQSLLRNSSATLVIGSTEPHYTASKTFQCMLSGKPVIALLHESSSALSFLSNSKADDFSIGWSEASSDSFEASITHALIDFLKSDSQDWNPDLSALNNHSAAVSTRQLLAAIEKVIAS